MAPDGDIRYYERAADLLGDPAVGLVLDAGGVIDEEFMRLAGEKKVEVLRGASLQAFLGLASEREECRGREKEILRELHLRVKELSILNEMSRILTSPLDLWLLIDRVAHLSARVADADSFAVLVYSEDLEKFVVSNTLGLGDVFKERVKLSLSDSLVEELMTFRKPLVMGRIQDWGISPLIKAAIGEGKKSMANIPLFSKERLLGFITLFSSQSEFQEEKEEMEFLFTLAGQAGIAIENAYLYENTRQKQTLVERLLSKLIQAQEEERKRIAAEIHDTIAQSLVSIHTRVQTCISLLKKAPDKLPSHLEELKNMVADNVKEVRQIIFNLRPSSLDDLGLIPSLENYIKRFEREQGIQVEFMVNNRERLIPAPVETAVFRITQEALTNVKKHSGGSKVLIKLGIEPKALSLRVADDGKGFQWEEVTEKFLRGDTHGLQGMKERISLLGGTFKVITAKGKGCVVSANIPFSRMEEETAAPEMKHAN
jgi:two-component system sensor histidine kinase DegS